MSWPVGHREIGKFVADVFEGKFEPLGEARGVVDRIRSIAKERAHFRVALQMAFRVLA